MGYLGDKRHLVKVASHHHHQDQGINQSFLMTRRLKIVNTINGTKMKRIIYWFFSLWRNNLQVNGIKQLLRVTNSSQHGCSPTKEEDAMIGYLFFENRQSMDLTKLPITNFLNTMYLFLENIQNRNHIRKEMTYPPLESALFLPISHLYLYGYILEFKNQACTGILYKTVKIRYKPL